MLAYMLIYMLTMGSFLLSWHGFRRPLRVLVLAVLLGGPPLMVVIWHGDVPLQGALAFLTYSFVAFGQQIPVAFMAYGVAIGAAGGAAASWIMTTCAESRASWTSALLVGIVVLPAFVGMSSWILNFQKDLAERQIADEIARLSFTGRLATHRVVIPASPRLYLFHDCHPRDKTSRRYCGVGFEFPRVNSDVRQAARLHQRSGSIIFDSIAVLTTEPDCGSYGYNVICQAQEEIDRWCGHIRPDLADSIWCRGDPQVEFRFRRTPRAVAVTPSDRDHPDLSARYADTVLGPGRVIRCFDRPDQTEAERQENRCLLGFTVADRVSVWLDVRRRHLMSGDPALAATIALIPEYWSALTTER